MPRVNLLLVFFKISNTLSIRLKFSFQGKCSHCFASKRQTVGAWQGWGFRNPICNHDPQFLPCGSTDRLYDICTVVRRRPRWEKGENIPSKSQGLIVQLMNNFLAHRVISRSITKMSRLDINSKYRMNSGHEIPVLGYGVWQTQDHSNSSYG